MRSVFLLTLVGSVSPIGAAYTLRPPDAKAAASVNGKPVTTSQKEAKEWHSRDAIFLPGVSACPLEDEALMRELRAIDERARLRALAARQRQEQQGKVELPELSHEFALMSLATEPLEAQHVGEATVDWIQCAADQSARDYLEFVSTLLEAREYIEALQTERGLLRATLGKFGPYSLMRRVDALLGPAPAAADFSCCTLARAHRPTVWHAFASAVRLQLMQLEYRLEGGQRTRSYRSRTEWRLLTKLGEVGQAQRRSSASGPEGRRQARALRSLQYRQAARSVGAQPAVLLPPTRKQRAMAAVAAAVAAAKAKEEARAELLAKVNGAS
jgi:hypothetical protein